MQYPMSASKQFNLYYILLLLFATLSEINPFVDYNSHHVYVYTGCIIIRVHELHSYFLIKSELKVLNHFFCDV